MRFQQFVEGTLFPVVGERWSHIRSFAEIRGGWEVWLQVEIYTALGGSSGVADFAREVPYLACGPLVAPQDKVDVRYTPKTAFTTYSWVELKAQYGCKAADSVTDALRRFLVDIGKVDRYWNEYGRDNLRKNDTMGAIVIIPQPGKSKFADIRKLLMIYEQDITAWICPDPKSKKQPSRFKLTAPPDQTDDASMLLLAFVSSRP